MNCVSHGTRIVKKERNRACWFFQTLLFAPEKLSQSLDNIFAKRMDCRVLFRTVYIVQWNLPIIDRQETKNLWVVCRFLLAVWIIGVPEPRDRKGFPQKRVFRYSTFRLRQVLMYSYIDQYLGVLVVTGGIAAWLCPGRSEARILAKAKHLFSPAPARQSMLPTQTPTQRVLDFFPGGKAAEAWC